MGEEMSVEAEMGGPMKFAMVGMAVVGLFLAAGVYWYLRGGSSQAVAAEDARPLVIQRPEITAVDAREDVPAFKREYTVKLNDSVSMKITAKNYYGLRVMVSGELNQGKKWVLFDPEDPADKILDRDLLPLVQRYCEQILKIDAAYRSNAPRRFTDESGVVWERAK